MPGAEIDKYFAATEFREVRDDLRFAVSKVGEPKVAIDCGCGAGADINYLVQNGFKVYGFDVDQESLSMCQTRFEGIESVTLSKSSFTTFDYPQASLVVADASLYFCPSSDFESVWRKIYQCLYPSGIFCGSFLGVEDTMARPGDNPSAFWPDVTAFEEPRVRELLTNLEVLRFNIHKSTANTTEGSTHNWHIFQVVP